MKRITGEKLRPCRHLARLLPEGRVGAVAPAFARAVLFACLLLALLGASLWPMLAQGSGRGPGSYSLSWFTVDGGGGSSAGGYSLSGSAGQPDAGTLSGGGYLLSAGFWSAFSSGAPPPPPAEEWLFLPLLRQ